MRVALVLDVTGSMASTGKNIGDANGGQEPGRAVKHAKTGSAKKAGQNRCTAEPAAKGALLFSARLNGQSRSFVKSGRND